MSFKLDTIRDNIAWQSLTKLLIKDAGHVAVGEEIQSKRALLLFICPRDEEKTLTFLLLPHGMFSLFNLVEY